LRNQAKPREANGPLFPIMITLTLLIIVCVAFALGDGDGVPYRAPLGLIGVVPTLLIFNQPFGINALVGLIALSGDCMHPTR
jgi:multidrug efflux pump subunit AcrB